MLTDSTRSLLRWLSDIIHVDLSNGQFLTLVHQHQYLLRLSGTVDMHTKQSPITRLERSFVGSRTTKQTLRQPSSISEKNSMHNILFTRHGRCFTTVPPFRAQLNSLFVSYFYANMLHVQVV